MTSNIGSHVLGFAIGTVLGADDTQLRAGAPPQACRGLGPSPPPPPLGCRPRAPLRAYFPPAAGTVVYAYRNPEHWARETGLHIRWQRMRRTPVNWDTPRVAQVRRRGPRQLQARQTWAWRKAGLPSPVAGSRGSLRCRPACEGLQQREP